jgi:polysaccharide biosynthesis/export protein
MERATGCRMAKSKLACALILLGVWLPASLPAKGQASPNQTRETVTAANSVIGAEDVLDVEVFDTPELSSATARVSETGEVNLPVLGQVEVAGLNASQAAQRIESKLRSRGIMLQPHVTVSIVESAPRGATLLGEVKSPGVYSVAGGRRLLDLIAMSGGLASGAGKLVTIAHRDDPHHPEMIALVPRAAQLGAQRNPVIQPGDTIMVGRAGIVYILGDVQRPGGFLVDNGEHISLMQALTLAGGWNKEAALSKAVLIRKVPHGHKELALDLKHVLKGKQADIRVEDGDILYVPTSLGKTLAYRGMEAVIAAAQATAVYSTFN